MDPIIATGAQAPLFQLTDLSGEIYALEDLRGWITVLTFWSAECGWCERVDHELLDWLVSCQETVKVLWIASNINESRDLIERVAAQRNLPTVLLDEHQTVANLYGAVTTPHFFVVDRMGKLAYQGAWYDITFRQRVATRVYVAEVVQALRHDLTPQVIQTPPYGCMLVRYSDSAS